MTVKTRKKKIAYKDIFIKECPRTLLDHWKAACALRGITMKQSFLSMVREFCKNLKKGEGA